MAELDQMRGRAKLVLSREGIDPAAAQSRALMQSVWSAKFVRQSRRRFVTPSDRDSTNHQISPFVGLP
jgi:hypothetical protein